ncbi:integral membrane sensor signal transduction histidine kinase [Hungatella hathewayi]|uniref:Integral membrane sensor signal transduction histidine kinase n=2 Tax=Hungatella hathewayi TaxID=154046 RepID=A0A174CJ07_9FIRM|nr:integral membrane sensor signal transduction histidine kinase [Hungatella hathewayi]
MILKRMVVNDSMKRSKKTIHIKYQFIKKNFIVLFCSFVLPTLALGIILVFLSWQKTSTEIQKRTENTLSLASGYLDGLHNNNQTVGLYLENSSLILGLNRMMSFKDISYTESVILKQFSLFINSVTNSSQNIDSLYIYIPNSLNRAYTSGRQFIFLNTLSDNEWVDRLTGLEHDVAIELRRKKEYSFESPKQVLSIYNRFHMYAGGWVMNYSLSNITDYYDSLLSFQDQSIYLLDQEGNLLLQCNNGNDQVSPDTIQFLNKPGQERILLHNIPYIIKTAEYEPYQIKIITLLPQSTLYTTALENAYHMILLLCLILIIIIIIIMAYVLSLNSYHQLHQVMEWFDQAEHHQALIPPGNKDMYSQILQNIIRIFLENDYLQVQLSERKYRQKAAELQALQYQINPHFLFNTLQTIHYEILEITNGQQSKANFMIEWLSDLLRFALGSPDSKVTLQQEIDNCMKYIQIQQERYDNTFNVDWRIPPSLISLEVPRLILQPMIENSIVHGLKYKKNGKIRIQVIRKDTYVVFMIVDNGCGMAPDKLRKLKEELETMHSECISEHIGLQNCNDRLVLAYSEESRVHVWSWEGRGMGGWFRVTGL